MKVCNNGTFIIYQRGMDIKNWQQARPKKFWPPENEVDILPPLKGLFNRKYGKFDHFLKIAYLFYYPIRCPFPLGYTRIGMMPIC